MTPEMGILIARALLTYGPTIAAGIAKIFEKKEHTAADWEQIFKDVKTSEVLIAEARARAGLPPL